MNEQTEFQIRVDGGEEQTFVARDSRYVIAVMEAFGALGLPYPCTVEIWVPDLVEGGYGPYFYRVADFIDMHGNAYVCPSVMSVSAATTQKRPPALASAQPETGV